MTEQTAKTELRRRYRRSRRSLNHTEQRQHAEAVARSVLASGMLLRASTCGIYFTQSADGELDTLPLLARLWSMAKTVGCPVIDPQRRMDFWQLAPQTPLTPNRFGIPEPRTQGAGAAQFLNPLRLSLLFLPLVAFDDQGTRLGMGAGFYDRFLARIARNRCSRPRLIGLAHEAQRAQVALQRSPWDFPLDGIVTEAGWQHFDAQAKVPTHGAHGGL